jgi:hypothetical protein
MQTNVHSICYLTQFLLNVAQHVSSLYKAHLQGSFVEITTAILLVYKILKKPVDVFGYWYLKTILKRL